MITTSTKTYSWTGKLTEGDYTISVNSCLLDIDLKKIKNCDIQIHKENVFVGNYYKNINNSNFSVTKDFDADTATILGYVLAAITEIELDC
jgi:hypothetical protein